MPAMSKMLNPLTAVALLLSTATAHTAVEEFTANGKTYPGFYQASKQDPGNDSPAWWTNQGWGYQPVFGDRINHPDIIAHMDADPSPYTADVDAGSDVTFKWYHQGSCGSGEDGWDCSHHGWTSTYLAPCNGDCANVDKTTLSFFKIHQSSLIDYREGRYSEGAPQEQTGYWGTDAIFYNSNNDNSQTVTIPQDIPNGDYVLRTEVVSIHNNGDVSQRQFWPQAFNIKVSGGNDGAQMPEGRRATEIYSADDELLQWDLYRHEAQKTFEEAPGPALAQVASAGAKKARRAHARDFKA